MNPLAGRTILVTRSREQAGDLKEALEDLGARVVEAPVIGFDEPEDWVPVDRAIERIEGYDRIVFTSANAVERFAARMVSKGRPMDRLDRARLVAIGPGTAAALAARGAPPDLVAADSRAEGVLELLTSRGAVAGSRILIPRAAVARDLLPDRLRAAGAVAEVVAVYRTVALPVTRDVLDLLGAGRIDAVTFTSSSTVTNLLAGIGGAAALAGVAVAVIGPVTGETARRAGLTPAIVSGSAGMRALASAIADYFLKS